MSDAKLVFLVGFMGAGKSAVGRALADRLGWELLDTDAAIRQAEGRSIDAIFRESGEGYFRDVEWRALRKLAGERKRVVATGGGLFLGVAQRAFIRRHGRSVWLDVDLATARRRLGGGAGRPLWKGADPLALRAMFEKRRAVYALADLRVDAGSASPDSLARTIAERL